MSRSSSKPDPHSSLSSPAAATDGLNEENRLDGLENWRRPARETRRAELALPILYALATALLIVVGLIAWRTWHYR
jgi:hypothetical protein